VNSTDRTQFDGPSASAHVGALDPDARRRDDRPTADLEEPSMLYRTTVDVAAPAGQVWSLVRDVESWPTWHPAMTTVELQGPQLEPGVPVRVQQPGRRPDLYTVLAVDEHHFLWAARKPGFRQWADHRVESLDPENCRVELAFGVDGMLGPVVGPLARRTVVRLVDAEAAHLKSHAEGGGGSAS
jgi:hypothetical protein